MKITFQSSFAKFTNLLTLFHLRIRFLYDRLNDCYMFMMLLVLADRMSIYEFGVTIYNALQLVIRDRQFSLQQAQATRE